jgi:hypothetical protein
MKLLLLAALLQGGTECPAYVRARGYPPVIAHLTRPYAQCMTLPNIPTANSFGDRRAQCADVRASQLALVEREVRGRAAVSRAARRRAATDSFDWIDHIAANFPGCETSVSIAGDGTELPNAAH